MASDNGAFLSEFSTALAGATAAAAARIVAVEGGGPWAISGVLWRTGLVVTAHEGLSGEDEFTVILPDGSRKTATLVGRDPSTDVALLKLETPEVAAWAAAPVPAVGSLALAVGRGEGGPLEAPSAFYMKSPPRQLRDSVALDACNAFIEGRRFDLPGEEPDAKVASSKQRS